MDKCYNAIMLASSDFLDIYKYILDHSMKAKDYDASVKRLSDIFEFIKSIRAELTKFRGEQDEALFDQHLAHLELVVAKMYTITISLKGKAENTEKYGFFKYRKDIKDLNSLYDYFEHTGNQMNSMNSEYGQ